MSEVLDQALAAARRQLGTTQDPNEQADRCAAAALHVVLDHLSRLPEIVVGPRDESFLMTIPARYDMHIDDLLEEIDGMPIQDALVERGAN